MARPTSPVPPVTNTTRFCCSFVSAPDAIFRFSVLECREHARNTDNDVDLFSSPSFSFHTRGCDVTAEAGHIWVRDPMSTTDFFDHSTFVTTGTGLRVRVHWAAPDKCHDGNAHTAFPSLSFSVSSSLDARASKCNANRRCTAHAPQTRMTAGARLVLGRRRSCSCTAEASRRCRGRSAPNSSANATLPALLWRLTSGRTARPQQQQQHQQ